MGRATLILDGKETRRRAALWVHSAPPGTRLTFNASKRSIPQNDLMWSLLTDFARQVKWHGRSLTPDQWKLMFLESLGHEMDLVPSLDGKRLVNLGRSSSRLSKEEMSDLIESIFKEGAERGVEFHAED